MTTEEIIRTIDSLPAEDFQRVRQAVRTRANREYRAAEEERQRPLRAAEAQRRTDWWRRVERCRPGVVLYVGASILLGDMYRGESVKVVRVDRDAERIHVQAHRIGGKLVPMAERRTVVWGPSEVAHLELTRTRPKDAGPEQARATGDRMARVLGEAMR